MTEISMRIEQWAVSFRLKSRSGVQPYKYSGKEFDQMHDLNWYDFHAHQYDPLLARFTGMDPLAEKYYSWSPYAYCANNPLRNIDPTEKNIIVLNDPRGAKDQGHIAILIGSESEGWIYTSKDGSNSNHATGGPSIVGEDRFDTIEEFNQSKYAKHYNGFSQRVRFHTTEEQDKAASLAMDESANSWYHVWFYNCIGAVSDALKAAGLNPGYSIYDPTIIKDSRPNMRFILIEKYNRKKNYRWSL